MTEQLFPILGTEVPGMLGRQSMIDRVVRDLTKPTPSNLSVIGTRYIGKTVFLTEMRKRIEEGDNSFKSVIHWHLGHLPPVSDDEFIAKLCDKVREALSGVHPEATEYCELLKEKDYRNLAEIMGYLDEENWNILMIWDGFGKPLAQGELTANLWDQMRNLFYGKGHKIVTSSRRPLSQLLRSQETLTSPFWNIFDVPVRLTCFTEDEVGSILESTGSLELGLGAKTELRNWSAGHPSLLLGFLNQIAETNSNRTITGEIVNNLGDTVGESLDSILSDIWRDLTLSSRDTYHAIIDGRTIVASELSRDVKGPLLSAGLVKVAGDSLQSTCRLLEHHVRGTAQEYGTITRLFGDWSAYRSNIQSLLERRLEQISNVPENIKRFVALAIERLPDEPDIALNNLTGIEESALDIVWGREAGSNRELPPDVIAHWTSSPRDSQRLISNMMRQDSWRIPFDRGPQLGLLQYLTGSHQDFENKARVTSKDTYVLINSIHSYRNRNQHSDGQPMHLGIAVAALTACVELLACLERENPTGH
jgi:hypothetical protein